MPYYINFKGNIAPSKKIDNTFSTINEAIEYLSSEYGITLKSDNLNFANILISSVKDFIKLNQNENMFRGLEIQTTNQTGNGNWEYNCNLDNGEFIVETSNDDYWDNIVEKSKEDYNNCIFTFR